MTAPSKGIMFIFLHTFDARSVLRSLSTAVPIVNCSFEYHHIETGHPSQELLFVESDLTPNTLFMF